MTFHEVLSYASTRTTGQISGVELLEYNRSLYKKSGVSVEGLRKIDQMVRVELLEHHQCVYKKGRTGPGIEDNQLYYGGRTVQRLSIFVQKGGIDAAIEDN